jgi:hypothetical protein
MRQVHPFVKGALGKYAYGGTRETNFIFGTVFTHIVTGICVHIGNVINAENDVDPISPKCQFMSLSRQVKAYFSFPKFLLKMISDSPNFSEIYEQFIDNARRTAVVVSYT